ncbi:MAG: sulfide-dependent adenosine diphosphate thiazole synthase [Candidatus Methanomethyliaceae archaeon]|nr:sulfide-dependent adenosine diphosphate thiazole synthase [Candidatus Methanomethyliaceae archaeon]MDW7970739.1 sulfide-dependent adenosine diphosphate thiazole synthase [Nitrososphaerota archaeon]
MQVFPVGEKTITEAIISKGSSFLMEIVDSDVIVVGAGPSGLVAAKYLAKLGLKTVVMERRLSFGGGMGGGGMLFPRIVVQEPAHEILLEAGVHLESYSKGVWIADVAESIAKLAASAIDSGAKILLGATVEDLIVRSSRVCGVVLQWSAIQLSGLHVDPLAIESRAVVDCTGHGAEVVTIAAKKNPFFNIKVLGEGSMDAVTAEKNIVDITGEVCPGLWVAGMAAAAVKGGPRMGPIFGGMLLSGKKVAELISKSLKK